MAWDCKILNAFKREQRKNENTFLLDNSPDLCRARDFRVPHSSVVSTESRHLYMFVPVPSHVPKSGPGFPTSYIVVPESEGEG
jgi:hypothetical protein